MKPLITLLFTFLTALGNAAFAGVEARAAAKAEIVNAEFGIFNTDASGKTSFVPTRLVSRKPGQSYGWIIDLRTDKEKVKWREEFVLPARPKTWGETEPFDKRVISKGGRVSTTVREVAPIEGRISNAWAVAPGDPKGRYRIRVFVDGALASTFEFDVR